MGSKPPCPPQTELEETLTRIIPPPCGHVDLLLWTLKEKLSGQHQVPFPLCQRLYSADQKFWPEIHPIHLQSRRRWSAPQKKMPDDTRSRPLVGVSGQKGAINVSCMTGFKPERASTCCRKGASFTTGAVPKGSSMLSVTREQTIHHYWHQISLIMQPASSHLFSSEHSSEKGQMGPSQPSL